VPTYQYACGDCGHNFDTVQSFSDDALTVCPVCGGNLRKVFNSVGIVFKGSGFYRNDSREKVGSSAGGKETKDSKDSKDSKNGAKSSGENATNATAKDGSSATSKNSKDSTSSSVSSSSSKSGGSSSGGSSSTTGSAA
jgi:putative FmdB family regulatory protein